ncbi:MAG: Hint domain-containing protein [Myxococcales bacterium]|nr:Hint domain-containing protein [Myxococcales bacterium]
MNSRRGHLKKLTLAGLLVGNLIACTRTSCIARGARVRTRQGERRIETLTVGDEVLAVDPSTGEVADAVVHEIRRAPRETIALRGAAFELVCTTDHPLWDPDAAAWANAGDWALGERHSLVLVTEAGLETVAVEERALAAGVAEVFDLVLTHPFHAFVANGVVVHNKSIVSLCNDEQGQFLGGAGSATGVTCACPNDAGLQLGELVCPEGPGIVRARCDCQPPACRTADGGFVSETVGRGLVCACEGWQPTTPWFTGTAECVGSGPGLVGTCECPPQYAECRTSGGQTLTFLVEDGGFVFVIRPSADAGFVPAEFPRCACAQPELTGRYACGPPRPTAPTIATCECPIDCVTDAGRPVQRGQACECLLDAGVVRSTWDCVDSADAGPLARCGCEP